MAERPSVPPPAQPSTARPVSSSKSAETELKPSPSGRPEALICDHRGAGVETRTRALNELGLDVVVSSTLRRTLEILASSPPTLIIVDPLAGAGGAEVSAIDRARGEGCDSALLVLVDEGATPPTSSARDRTTPRGVWDFARRNGPESDLILRVQLLLRQLELRHEMERLRHLATHDDRTDLLRPQVFQDQLRQHFSASQRHHLNLGLLLIDLDHFGRVNKIYDHTVGDAIITRVGAAIRSSLRAEDVAARLGGDEFCVLLPYTRKVDAARVVQRLLEHIREAREDLGSAAELRVTASLGFETFNGSDLDSVEQLRLHAEEALRAAKRLGGDRGVYYRSLDSTHPDDGDEST